jgi:CRISPR-associated endoribonuclease Cas6
MRLVIELAATEEKRISLPVQYNHLIQSAIYAVLDSDFAAFLHDRGYDGGGRCFKLFAFSRLIGKYRLNQGEIDFEEGIKLVIVSPVEEFCQHLLNGLLNKGVVRLGNSILSIVSIKAELPKVEGDFLKLRLLSPVVAYSTLTKANGDKFTCYFQPGERDFTNIVAENLRKKYEAFWRKSPPEGEVTVNAARQPKLHVIEYKGFVIKGYSGMLFLNGPQELLQIALDAGIGSKNSMGFGCGEKDKEGVR